MRKILLRQHGFMASVVWRCGAWSVELEVRCRGARAARPVTRRKARASPRGPRGERESGERPRAHDTQQTHRPAACGHRLLSTQLYISRRSDSAARIWRPSAPFAGPPAA